MNIEGSEISQITCFLGIFLKFLKSALLLSVSCGGFLYLMKLSGDEGGCFLGRPVKVLQRFYVSLKVHWLQNDCKD